MTFSNWPVLQIDFKTQSLILLLFCFSQISSSRTNNWLYFHTDEMDDIFRQFLASKQVGFVVFFPITSFSLGTILSTINNVPQQIFGPRVQLQLWALQKVQDDFDMCAKLSFPQTQTGLKHFHLKSILLECIDPSCLALSNVSKCE